MSPLQFLDSRLSVSSRQLTDPGPDQAQLDAILKAAIRVPDHGKLTPWRLLLIRGAARAQLGSALSEIRLAHEPDASASVIEKDRARYSFAPLIVAVIARPDSLHPKVPAREQLLSAGCVAYNLLLAAQGLGFGAQWLTGWAAYNSDAAALLGLAADEQVIAFVHIGTVKEPAHERTRPEVADVVRDWLPE